MAVDQAGAPIVVVGAGLAGWTTVREFRKLDTTTPVVLVTADAGDFYAKPTLSNALAQKRTPQQLVTTPAAQMAETLKVTLRAYTTVQSIHTEHATLTLQHGDGSDILAYRSLVLCTGAQPIRAPLSGTALDRVSVVNSLGDFRLFYERLLGAVDSGTSHGGDGGQAPAAAKTVLIVGAGLIGCEFANDLLQAGHRVHVVDPAARPLAALLPAEAGIQLQEALEARGAVWHFGLTVQAIDPAEHAAGGPVSVTLADGQTLQADVVLSAIGLRADTALAMRAGIHCERGIVVDARLQTSAPRVYALGDAAQYASAGERTLPYVMPIMNAAKALASTLAGTATELVFPLMPVSVKTPALPIVVCSAHPAIAGAWVADAGDSGAWRFVDTEGVQRGFVLTGKSTTRRMEFAKATRA